MNIARVPRGAVVTAVLGLATLLQAPVTTDTQTPFQTTPTLFSGQATVVKGSVLGLPITLVDTGTVAPEGGALEAHLLCYPGGPNCTVALPDQTNGALAVAVLSARVVAQGNRSRAGASVADLTLNAVGQNISATFIQAQAAAECSNGQASVHAESDIAELVINGQSVAVTGDVNQRIDLPAGGVVLINEQIGSATAGAGDVTVNALHITIPGPVPGTNTDVVIAQAHADIQCGQRFCPADKDFVTGGGQLPNPRKTFAVGGGIKNGGFWGHLLFIDHGSGMRVKGTGVTAYAVTGVTTRHIEGTAEINGSPGGTYQVDVDDQGEPGRSDAFALQLNRAPVASGILSGGNIQLHTCK